MDQFAQIAANGIGGNAALLEPVTPIPHETVICRLEQADAQPVAVKPHLSTTEELKTELAAMREAYRPFLENHAPAFESLRRRMDLTCVSARWSTGHDPGIRRADRRVQKDI